MENKKPAAKAALTFPHGSAWWPLFVAAAYITWTIRRLFTLGYYRERLFWMEMTLKNKRY